MAKKEEIQSFFNEERLHCEELLKQNNAYDDVPDKLFSGLRRCYENLISIYLINLEQEKAKKMLNNLSQLESCNKKNRLDIKGFKDAHKNDTSLLIEIGKGDIENAIIFTLACKYPEKVKIYFEWAVENCKISEEISKGMIKYKCYDDLSRAYLWWSYALICLEKYSEAHDLLINIVPFSNKWKKMTGEIYWLIEYSLPKALIPLCEFKQNPTRQNLIDTQKGIEEYIKALRHPYDKMTGYLYYFHLKEIFADVYNADPKDYPETVEAEPKPDIKETPITTPEGEEEIVWFWDLVDLAIGDEFGTDKELEDYASYVSKLDGFPELASIFDLYVKWDEFDAQPMYDEAKRLLELPGLDPKIKAKTEIILDITGYSVENGSGILVLKAQDWETEDSD